MKVTMILATILALMQVISCGSETKATMDINHYCESVPEPERAECFHESHEVMKLALQNRNGV